MRKGIPVHVRSVGTGMLGQVVSAGNGGGPSPIVCLFPLDADVTETTNPATGLEGKLTPSLDNQSGSYTVQSQLAGAEDYGMIPANSLLGTGQKLDVSTGITAVGLTLEAVPALSNTGGGEPIILNLLFANPANFAVVGHAQVRRGINTFSVYNVFTAGYVGDCAGNQVALVFNAATGDVSLSFTDDLSAPQNVVITTYDPVTVPSVVPLLIVGEAAGVAVDNQNLVFTIRFETAADQITAPVPAGARDACGNLI